MRRDNIFWWFVNFPLAFWRDFYFPLHGECPLSLLVNQFQGSWIHFQVGWWRCHSYLSYGYEWIFIVSSWRSINLSFSSISLFPHSFFSIPPHSHVDGALGVVLALFWEYLIPNIGYMIYGYLILFTYSI